MVKTSPAFKQRIESIDILRGLIMLIMAIDHVRDFFHPAIAANEPTHLETTWPLLFFTRFITHFCAPLFIFLSGISAHLAGVKRTRKQLSGFLLKRGLWLIVVEVVLITFAHTIDPLFHLVLFNVIWAIGTSMIILGLLVWAPLPVIAAIGGVLLFGRNILDYVSLPQTGAAGVIWKLFFTAKGNYCQVDETHFVKLHYAIMPWAGVMMLGYVFGALYRSSFEAARRKKILYTAGIAFIAMFLFLRAFNIYGDPAPWSVQHSVSLTIISFFNVTKYPASLLYLSITIGPGLIFLAYFERVKNRLTDIFIVYGNVPFFFYVIHWYVIRSLSLIEYYTSGYGPKDMVNSKLMFMFRPEGMGYNLAGVYLVWLIVILALYLPCRWYCNYKRTHRQWWLSYL